jgi:hypothetical protein
MIKSNTLVPITKPVIRMAPGLKALMAASVGRLPPEHYALLAGRLDDPFTVTDLIPMPPLVDEHGNYRQSSGSVTLNGPFIEYILNTQLIPFDKYLLGVMHSHPGSMTTLSSGREGSGQGDMPSIREHLEAAARNGRPWKNYLAPIVTNPGPSPTVTGWVVRLDHADPIPASIIWESEQNSRVPAPKNALDTPAFDLDALRRCDSRYQALIKTIVDDTTIEPADKEDLLASVRALRAHDLRSKTEWLMKELATSLPPATSGT